MQLIDSKLYIANNTALPVPVRHPRADHRSFTSWLKETNASERLLALMLAGFLVTASPALLGTVRSAVSLALQILLQAGHFGLVAFQIFSR
jgi:hypothetical protein